MPKDITGPNIDSLIDFCRMPESLKPLNGAIDVAECVVSRRPSSKRKFNKLLKIQNFDGVRDLATTIIRKYDMLPFGGALEFEDFDEETGDVIETNCYIDVFWRGYSHETFEYQECDLVEQILALFFRRHEDDIGGSTIEAISGDVGMHTGIKLEDIKHLSLHPYQVPDKSLIRHINTWFNDKPRWKILSYALLRIINHTGCRVLDVSYEDIQQNGEEPLRWEDLSCLIAEFDEYREKEKAFKKFRKKYSENKKLALQLIEILNEFTKDYIQKGCEHEEKVKIKA